MVEEEKVKQQPKKKWKAGLMEVSLWENKREKEGRTWVDQTINLQKSVLSTLERIGKAEKAKPHLTIARVRSGRDKNAIAELIKKHENTDFGAMLVDKIKLKKSTLTPKGPIYEDIAVFELGK